MPLLFYIEYIYLALGTLQNNMGDDRVAVYDIKYGIYMLDTKAYLKI
jgi:hypothetical protein